MHRALSSRWLSRALCISERSPASRIPDFLCPALQHTSTYTTATRLRPLPAQACAAPCRQRRWDHTETATATAAAEVDVAPVAEKDVKESSTWRQLPLTCPGCGAFTQTNDAQSLGYFNSDSKRVRSWLNPKRNVLKDSDGQGDQVVDDVLKALDPKQLEELGLDPTTMVAGEETEGQDTAGGLVYAKPPVCDRCHNLLHHNLASDTAKVGMFHPTVETLRETIEESPYKYNHIYHVIDAADFPMSLVPRLNVLLGDVELRTRNRRSRSAKYHKDRKTDMSFIITRGDLLGPTKKIVDSMMPYLREVLREALGRLGDRVRLGNVKCVSAKRGWWTKSVKEDIWRRGGAGWMVGKVNVGKSQLMEAVYPKGRIRHEGDTRKPGASAQPGEIAAAQRDPADAGAELLDQEPGYGDLLPPPQPLQKYPDMPVVSSLPGTTASPIRLPFGNKKGELIDLPGLARSDLELFVKEPHRQSLIMQDRVVPEQHSIKAGSSLLLGGGLIRITPRTPDITFLMYNFTPLPEHLTSNEKAVGFQDQTRESIGLSNITLPEMGDKMKCAGSFKLSYDVTKTRAGPLTRKNAIGLSVDRLAFRVLSVDILIEGVGYVEVVAQVRARDMQRFPPLDAPARSPEPAPLPERETSADAAPEDTDDAFAAVFNRNRRDMTETRSSKTRLSEPRTSEPGTSEPGTSEPGTSEPGTSEPGTSEPGTSETGTSETRPSQAKPSEAKPLEVTPSVASTYRQDPQWPAVDVFTPEGRFVGTRRPINGWMNNKPLVRPEHKRKRPRKSMKGQKKKEKQERRARE